MQDSGGKNLTQQNQTPKVDTNNVSTKVETTQKR
jgi:hypothetical protein